MRPREAGPAGVTEAETKVIQLQAKGMGTKACLQPTEAERQAWNRLPPQSVQRGPVLQTPGFQPRKLEDERGSYCCYKLLRVRLFVRTILGN